MAARSHSPVPPITPLTPEVQEVCLRYHVLGYYSSGKGDLGIHDAHTGRYIWFRWYHDRFVPASTTRGLGGEVFTPIK